jgi:peptidoglycan/LPS O-acetylase OafA/YrhL
MNLKIKHKTHLDIIRTIAICLIFWFHYFSAVGFEKTPLVLLKNGGLGSVGTTMFFIVSGCALHIKYNDKFNIRKFYVKRFLSIFPLLYLTFICAYVYKSICLHSWNWGGSFGRLFYTVLGIDAYVAFYQIPTYYLVGEWFTAIIVCIYILYPILNYLFNHFRWITTVIIAVLYFGNVSVAWFTIPDDVNIITGIFMFWIGMLIEQYEDIIVTKFKTVKIIVCAGVVFIIAAVRLPGSGTVLWKNLLGIALFLLLMLLVYNSNRNILCTKIFAKTSKYSYGIYLVHHFIIYNFAESWMLFSGTLGYVISFMMTLGVSILLSVILANIINFILSKL